MVLATDKERRRERDAVDVIRDSPAERYRATVDTSASSGCTRACRSSRGSLRRTGDSAFSRVVAQRIAAAF
jgi:hypothetical protein